MVEYYHVLFPLWIFIAGLLVVAFEPKGVLLCLTIVVFLVCVL
jgi:hypothetical protein